MTRFEIHDTGDGYVTVTNTLCNLHYMAFQAENACREQAEKCAQTNPELSAEYAENAKEFREFADALLDTV